MWGTVSIQSRERFKSLVSHERVNKGVSPLIVKLQTTKLPDTRGVYVTSTERTRRLRFLTNYIIIVIKEDL